MRTVIRCLTLRTLISVQRSQQARPLQPDTLHISGYSWKALKVLKGNKVLPDQPEPTDKLPTYTSSTRTTVRRLPLTTVRRRAHISDNTLTLRRQTAIRFPLIPGRKSRATKAIKATRVIQVQPGQKATKVIQDRPDRKVFPAHHSIFT